MKDLTVGKEGKLILMFAIPMLLGNVFQQLYNVVDSIIVGQYLGKQALAAVGASFPVLFVLISLVIGIGSGSTIIIAQYYGAKDMENVRKAIDTLWIFMFIASLVITAIGLVFCETIFNLMGLPADVVPQASIYFKIFVSGFVLMFGYNSTSAILRGLGDSKTPLYFLIISTIINIILVVLFVLVLHWGIAGASFATVIAQGVSFILGIIYLNRTHEVIKFSPFKLKFDKAIFVKSMKIGIPSGMQQTFVALGMMALVTIVNKFGTNAIAAYSVAGRIESFAILPAMNFAMALSAFVGQNIGANRPDRVRIGYHATLKLSVLFSLIITTIVVLFGNIVMTAFTSDPKVIEIGESYLKIVAPFFCVFSAMFVSNGLLRGAGDTLIPMFITLFSLWLLRVPFSYFLSRHFGTDGIWWGIPIAWTFGFIASYLYYMSGRWKRKAVVKYPTVVEDVN